MEFCEMSMQTRQVDRILRDELAKFREMSRRNFGR